MWKTYDVFSFLKMEKYTRSNLFTTILRYLHYNAFKYKNVRKTLLNYPVNIHFLLTGVKRKNMMLDIRRLLYTQQYRVFVHRKTNKELKHHFSYFIFYIILYFFCLFKYIKSLRDEEWKTKRKVKQK